MTCLQSLLQSYPGNILKHRNEPLLYFTSILQLCDVGMIEMSGGQCFIAIQSVSRPLHPFAAERQLNGNLLLEHTVSPQIHQAGTAAESLSIRQRPASPIQSAAVRGMVPAMPPCIPAESCSLRKGNRETSCSQVIGSGVARRACSSTQASTRVTSTPTGCGHNIAG